MVLQNRLGITPEESVQIVQSVKVRIEATLADLRQTLDRIQQQALEVAQTAFSLLSVMAMWLMSASLLGPAAAMGGTFAGKPDGFLGDRLDDYF